MTIPAPTPRYRTDATVLALKITDTTTKSASATITQVINNDTANITIFPNMITCTTKRRSRPAKVLKIENSILVPQVPDR